MPVYVDPPMDMAGKWEGGSHMIADTLDELHGFAERLGLKREWFQPISWPHYDLTANKRRLAIKLGAKEVSGRDALKILKANYGKAFS